MGRHITVRMAWHDNGWDGKICQSPAGNSYCTGNHSLLSERVARDKRVDLEESKRGHSLDVLLPDYLPPCYWTSNAFGTSHVDVVHEHPFAKFRKTKRISESLPPNSVFTWPFRLSITHSKGVHAKDGQYFEDVDPRIDRYIGRLNNGESLVFFYLNYDNPISGDDNQYALVGCSVLSETQRSGEFQFTDGELSKLRASDNMQNFPTRNWAIRVSYDFAKSGVRLPYHEYLRHVAEYPADEDKIEEIKVLVEEPTLLPRFKYVSEQLNDDQCLYLLYKLRRAFKAVERHGIVKPGSAASRINGFIENLWTRRGLYPGLGAVVAQLARLSQGDTGFEFEAGDAFVQAVRASLSEGEDLLEAVFALLEGTVTPPSLASHKKVVRQARKGLADYSHLVPLLRKLSLFALTGRQVGRIISPDGDVCHAFQGRTCSPDDLAKNPYLLCENYIPSTNNDEERLLDLDREQATDAPIDYFTIDIGMFPDEDYLEPNETLQNLGVASPERLRAFIIEALHVHEAMGDSYASIGALLDQVTAHPLFHSERFVVGKEQLLAEKALKHFRERLHVQEVDQDHFFYIRETWRAERTIERVVDALIQAADHKPDVSWVTGFLDEQVKVLCSAPGFNDALFREERRRLIEGCLSRRFFVVTGRPGAGKTRALRDVLSRLKNQGERVVVLAPTGKATLRLAQEANWADVQTIDRWIFRSGLATYLEDVSKLDSMAKSGRFEPFDSLVIDEMSMVHLPHLAVILRSIEVHQPGSVKRVILVGDEHQLPPIGCGRPFYDIVNHLRSDSSREDRHTVRLRTNCRQQHDNTVLDAAYLFAGKNRYSTELWKKLLNGGRMSPWLNVELWKDRDDLQQKLINRIDELLAKDKEPGEDEFNLLLGLYDTGYVPKNDAATLTLDRAQVLTPYRAGHAGTLALNDALRSHYRPSSWSSLQWESTAFVHSDKIIRITNYYAFDPNTKRKELRLSNGSIGVLCRNKDGRKAYFPESKWPFDWNRFDEADFELAYAITVHKSQGSEFQETFVVIPERRALLNRELVYTAMTRSKGAVTLLVQGTERESPLQIARERSALLSRNSSIFATPIDSRRTLEPEKGVRVKSKIEYVIYRALVEARERGLLTFEYEQDRELPIGGRSVQVRPDFTIHVADRRIYWEHLGMLDREDYASKWRDRLSGYENEGLLPFLVTTDDLAGVRQSIVEEVINDVISGLLKGTEEGAFSKHHYRL